MVSASANGASEVPGSSRGASWGHPCGPRGPKRFPSPVPDPGPGTLTTLGTGYEMRVRDWRSPGAASDPRPEIWGDSQRTEAWCLFRSFSVAGGQGLQCTSV